MQREIKRENKPSGDVRVVITDSDGDTFELVACACTTGRLWDIFGFYYGADDEDNIPGYREDGLTMDEVEEKIKEFISEYGNPKG